METWWCEPDDLDRLGDAPWHLRAVGLGVGKASVDPRVSRHGGFGVQPLLLADRNDLLLFPLVSDRVFRWSMPGEEQGWTRLLIDQHSGSWLSWESGGRQLVRWKRPSPASLQGARDD